MSKGLPQHQQLGILEYSNIRAVVY